MCEEEVFDLGGVDILATPDDHVLDATHDVTVAVFIDHRNVTEAPNACPYWNATQKHGLTEIVERKRKWVGQVVEVATVRLPAGLYFKVISVVSVENFR